MTEKLSINCEANAMSKLVKFNQYANRVDENIENYSFGIIIKNIGEHTFSFDIVDNNGEFIKFINLNEWRIFSIFSSDYFTRKKITFDYIDPNGEQQRIETGGRTIDYEDNHGINDLAFLLEELLVHFHRVSCFENIESVIDRIEQLKKENKYYGSINHLFMGTSF